METIIRSKTPKGYNPKIHTVTKFKKELKEH